MATIMIAMAFTGCGGSDGTAATTDRETETTTASEPKVDYPVPQAPPQKGPLKKLVIKDLQAGTGPVAHWGDEVAVRYVGLDYRTADIYSQHWKSVAPLDFALDGESVSVGWQKGIEGMKVGGRREVLIPKRLLFEDEDVAYVIEMLWVNAKGGQAAGTEGKPPGSFAREDPFSAIHWVSDGEKPRFDPPDRKAPKKLLHRDLEIGSGSAAQRDDEVTIFYTGAVYRTGKPRYGGAAGPFPLGSGGLGRAFEEGLKGMEPGGRRELIVPSRLLGGTAAIDYAIAMKSVAPAAKKP